MSHNIKIMNNHALNIANMVREVARTNKGNMSLSEGHQPIKHHRLDAYMNNRIKQRGGDNRDVLRNAVSQIRMIKDNDKILVDRPLG